MDGGVSGRSSYGRDDDEEKPTALHHHHRPRLEGTSGGNIIAAVKVEKGRSYDDQQGKETLKMEISSSGDLDSSSTSLNQNHEQNDRLESARAEMSEVKEENERLKMYLDRIMREYKALQMHFFETLKQGDHHENKKKTSPQQEDHHHTSLSLGPTAISGSSSEKNKKTVSMNWESTFGIDKENLDLSLNYDCNKGVSKSETLIKASSNSPVNISPENSFEDQKEETDEFRPPPAASKVQKRSGGDDEVSQQNAAKKTRVSVRARCDTPTMHDGCQWRKYGQKISKGNPCPRAYYRCTIAPSCPVRKQVQRCAEDMSILTTTYEGSHNHPLPVSATAMASTTSAAASMLLSGSSSSPASIQGLTPNATTDLHGLNFYLSDPSRSKQFYLPNATPMSSSAPTHPTITLDLTNSNPNNYSSAPSNFSRFGSSVYSPLPTRSYNLSTSVSFGSPEPISELPVSWGNGGGNYGQLYPRSHPQETLLHLQNNNHRQQDSIAAATKAITADPNFQSALATALKSIIGGSGSSMGNQGGGGGGGGDGLGAQRLRWNSDNLINSIHGAQSTVALQAAVGCGSSFLNNSSLAATTANSQQQQQLRNLVFKLPSLPLSNPKNNASSTSSPNDHTRDHSKLL